MNMQLEELLDSISEGILIIDRDYTVIYANKRVAELYAKEPGGIVGKKCHQVIHDSPIPCEQGHSPTEPCSHREVFLTGEPVYMKHHHHLPDGSLRIFAISASPLRNEQGEISRVVQLLRDITVEEKLRDELAVNHQTLEAIFNNAPFAISYLDKEMRVIRLNPAMEELVGTLSEEAKGKHCYDCWGQYSNDADRRGRERICDPCRVPDVLLEGKKYFYKNKIGDRVLEITTSPVLDSQGEIIGTMEIGSDITDRYLSEEALRQSENDYRALFESSPNVLCIGDFSGIRQYLSQMAPGWDSDPETFFQENSHELAACLARLRILRANQAVLNLSGAATEMELIARLSTVIGPEAVAQAAGGVAAMGRGETSYCQEIILRHLVTGARIYCILCWNVVPGYEESYRRVILSLTDISARKITEQRVADYRALLVETEEAERRRLAGELHDKLGQQLTALGLNLTIIEQGLPPEQCLALHGRIADMTALVEEMTGQVRNIMADLRPPVLDDYGLGAALRWYGAIFSKRCGIDFVLIGGDIPRLPAPVEIALFRVAQEALNNVAKHSRASRVEIRSSLAGNRLSLVIYDNGAGFTESDESDFGNVPKLGLVSMRERVASVGGKFTVNSAPGEGVIILVEVGI